MNMVRFDPQEALDVIRTDPEVRAALEVRHCLLFSPRLRELC